jgi:signal transduction histidine kinase/ActR/RegA family two-component response regulator
MKVFQTFFFTLFVFFSVQISLKAQIGHTSQIKIELEKYQKTIDSIHYSYQFENYPQLIKKLTFVSKIAAQNKDRDLYLQSKFYIAEIFHKAGNYSEAESIIKKVIQEIEEGKDGEFIYPFVSYLHIKILIEQNKLEDIEEIFQKAVNDDKGESKIHSTLKHITRANILYTKNELDESLQLLQQPEKHLESYPTSYLLAEIYKLKALIYNKQGNLERSIFYAKKLKAHSETNGFKNLELSASSLLASIYSLKNNNEEQIRYLLEEITIKDEIINFQKAQFTESKISESKGLQTALETISKLTLTNSEQEESIKFNQFAIILSVLLISFLALFTVSLYRNNILRARANSLLQDKNSELIESREKALLGTKYREQFLSTITHELRTPIYAVTGLTYLLLKENPTSQQEEHLKSLKHSGEHLLSLINNILDINKLESNKVNRVNFDFYLVSQIKKTIKTFKKTAEENEVALHLEIDENIPNLLNGDMLKISQVLINLISNAIKFTKGGDVWVIVNLEKEIEESVFVKFEVIDNGRGIPKEKQKQIFEKFNQGTDQINANFGGTGLGLPIVKNILLFLNSQIHLESGLGKGSRFFFEIEFTKTSADTNTNSQDITRSLHHSEEEEKAVFEGKKVLVVEDNKLNQKITCKILEKKNIFSDIANNGKEALKMVKKNKYELILMDIHMPVMNGIEATKEIRKNQDQTPIIALTAVSLSEGKSEFLDYGFNDIIPKPYKTELFYDIIYRILKNKNNFKADR